MLNHLNKMPKTVYGSIINLNRSSVLLTLIFASLITFVLAGYFNGELDKEWLSNAFLNFSTELMGAIVAFILFDLILGKRQERENEALNREQKKLTYLAQMQSEDNSLALIGARLLKSIGCFEDGSLKGVNLEFANLFDSSLNSINLQKATLCNANFSSSFMLKANLKDTDSGYANFSRANLWNADLSTGHFYYVDFSNTRFWRANLIGANLKGANLENATFKAGPKYEEEVKMDETTILPDGSKYQPQLGIEQLKRFTDRSHPKFWRSDDEKSPAYETNIIIETKTSNYI